MDKIPFKISELEDTVSNRFRRVANLCRNQIALEFRDEKFSYSDLDKLSDQIAHVILSSVDTKTLNVAILMRQTGLAIASILGVLKAGKTFILFPPDMPVEKLQMLWEDASHPALLTTNEKLKLSKQIAPQEIIICLDNSALSDLPVVPSDLQHDPKDVATISYTSGSTGKPKGVLWHHELVLHTAYLNISSYQFSPGDKVAMISAYGYGAAMTASFAVLLSGATLCPADPREQTLASLIDWLRDEKVTVLSMPPVGLFRNILKAIPDDKPLEDIRMVIVGGDDLFQEDIVQFRKKFNSDTLLVYRLGGSETMLMREHKINTSKQLSPGKVSVGYAVPDKEVLLLNDKKEPVPDGMSGEIAIRSRYLALGYWENPDLTAEKFQQDPDDKDKRIYFTGDMGRINENGELEFLGRKDHMVKVRGFSVQLETIELGLKNIDGVQDVAVIVTQTQRNKRLVAYLTAAGADKISTKEIRHVASKYLPDYMIPSLFIWLDKLPKTATGKIDRNALPTPSSDGLMLESKYVAPSTEKEKKIVEIWQKLLELKPVGVNDNFFELGGDSLLVLEMILAVEQAFIKSVSKQFFNKPTIAYLAELLNTDKDNLKQEYESFTPEKFGREPSNQSQNRKRRRKWMRWIKRGYTLSDWVWILEKAIVGYYFNHKTYLDTRELSLRWSKNRFIGRMLHRGRAKLFSEWLMSFGIQDRNSNELFEMAVFTNLQFGHHKYRFGKDENNSNLSEKNYIKLFEKSPKLYWRTLSELLQKTPIGEMSVEFPMVGTEYLLREYKKGKGVILVSFHGMPRVGEFYHLMRFLKIKDIPTISYIIPMRQSSSITNKRGQRGLDLAASMNAEIALFGQRYVQQGGIVQFQSDNIFDTQGATYKVLIGDRVYMIKGGFAELSLNTGAPIVPFVRYCLPDGRIQMEFKAPLDPGEGNRYDKVKNLIQDYGKFIELAIKEHPEAISWSRIKNHFKREKHEASTFNG